MNERYGGFLHTVLSETSGDQALLVVAVSGGPDSLAMLHKLLYYVGAARLHVAHLDHCLRPKSKQEANYVAGIAATMGLAYHEGRVDVPLLARHEGLTLEEAARQARYRFLTEVAQEVGATVVAVGHHADDQVETILLRFLRGTGLTGLRGMQAISPVPGAPELTLIRPQLDQSRADIEAYCQEHGLHPLVDESNRDPVFLRNRVRHQLLPVLATYNPQIREHLLRLGEIAAEEDALVQDLVDQVWLSVVEEVSAESVRLNRRRWSELPLGLQRRTVRRACGFLLPDGQDLSFEAVQQATQIASRKKSGTTFMLPAGVILYVDYNRLIFSISVLESAAGLPQLQPEEATMLPVPGMLALGDGWFLKAEPLAPNLQEVLANDDPWRAYVDVQDSEQLVVRGRLPGERMQPLGMGGRSTSLQDVMVNRKIPAAARAGWPIVATPQHIVWLVGHQVDRRASVTDASQSVVLLECVRLNEETC